MLKALKRHPVRIVIIVFAVTVLSLAAFMWLRPSVKSASPSLTEYPVRGVDISAHNGEIDYEKLAGKVDFVYIKATEGVTWVDRFFEKNYACARNAGLKVGVYHFFRFDRSGISQAINVYDNLWKKQIDLPVAIDVEETGNPSGIDADTVISRLNQMVGFLEKRGVKVMFYTNKKGYRKYIEHDFPMYPLWLCSFSNPRDDIKWRFWQFTHSETVDGISGEVDMNVFNGTREDFKNILVSQSWK